MHISPPRAVAFDILLRVERQKAYAAELLHSNRLDELSAPDCGLATELVMGVLRWQSRLDEAVTAASARAIGKLDLEVLVALRLAIYQLRYLDRIPAHAAINDSVELVKRAQKRSAAPFVNAVLRKVAALKPEPAPDESVEQTAGSLAHEFAHPLWLVERWIMEFGIERARYLPPGSANPQHGYSLRQARCRGCVASRRHRPRARRPRFQRPGCDER